MSKGTIPPGQKLPGGAIVDKFGKVRLPKTAPKVMRITLRVPRTKV